MKSVKVGSRTHRARGLRGQGSYFPTTSRVFCGRNRRARRARSTNMKMPKRLLVASGPIILGPKAKRSGAPGEAKNGGKPVRDAVGDFGVLEKIDDDAEQAEDAAGGDQAAGVERAGAGFAFVFLSWWWLRRASGPVRRQTWRRWWRWKDTSRWRRPANERRGFPRRSTRATPIKTRRQGSR